MRRLIRTIPRNIAIQALKKDQDTSDKKACKKTDRDKRGDPGFRPLNGAKTLNELKPLDEFKPLFQGRFSFHQVDLLSGNSRYIQDQRGFLFSYALHSALDELLGRIQPADLLVRIFDLADRPLPVLLDPARDVDIVLESIEQRLLQRGKYRRILDGHVEDKAGQRFIQGIDRFRRQAGRTLQRSPVTAQLLHQVRITTGLQHGIPVLYDRLHFGIIDDVGFQQ